MYRRLLLAACLMTVILVAANELSWPALLFVYGVTLPLWLPPVIIALRSDQLEDWQKYLAVGLAALSPLIGLIAGVRGYNYCAGPFQGPSGGFFVGDLFPHCPNAALALAVILAPPTIMGVGGWLMALVPRKPRPRRGSWAASEERSERHE
jgi:hypothetical protein